jgi:hypothetical protein
MGVVQDATLAVMLGETVLLHTRIRFGVYDAELLIHTNAGP